MSSRQRTLIALSGRQSAHHEAVVHGKDRYVSILTGGLLLRLHDQRGVSALLAGIDTAKKQARAINLPIVSPTGVDQDMSMMTTVALGAHFQTTVMSVVPPAAKAPHIRIEAGPLILLTYDQAALDSLTGIFKRAERMATELPGGFKRPASETYRRLTAFAKARGVELGDDTYVYDSILAVARGEDVRWLNHAERGYANTILELGRGWRDHVEKLPDNKYLLAEPLVETAGLSSIERTDRTSLS